MASERADVRDDELYQKYISDLPCAREIQEIRDNDEWVDKLVSGREHAAALRAKEGWELLGKYIANNTRVDSLTPEGDSADDAKMSALFSRLAGATGLTASHFCGTAFGQAGVRSMIPFLENSRDFEMLDIGSNVNFDIKCFELLVELLRGGSVERLFIEKCNLRDISAMAALSPQLTLINFEDNMISDISVLRSFTNLEILDLSGNEIGLEGCKIISAMLRREHSRLERLGLSSNHLGDAEAELIATSLRKHDSLKELYFENDNITLVGHRAFLKVVNDASSISNCLNSNHLLEDITVRPREDAGFPDEPDGTDIEDSDDSDYYYRGSDRSDDGTDGMINEVIQQLRIALKINRTHAQLRRLEPPDPRGTPKNAARAKVLRTQLDSTKRMKLCELQGVEYCHGGIFAEIEPYLLPNLLALVGKSHGQNELFLVLVNTVPYVASAVDKKKALKERIAENAADIAELEAVGTHLKKQLAAIEAEDTENSLGGKKRRREGTWKLIRGKRASYSS